MVYTSELRITGYYENGKPYGYYDYEFFKCDKDFNFLSILDPEIVSSNFYFNPETENFYTLVIANVSNIKTDEFYKWEKSEK